VFVDPFWPIVTLPLAALLPRVVRAARWLTVPRRRRAAGRPGFAAR
jgi:hypothetical protein